MAVVCEDCNASNPDGMRFCDQCSTPLPPSSQVSSSYSQNNSAYTAQAIPMSAYQPYLPNQNFPTDYSPYNQPANPPVSYDQSPPKLSPFEPLQTTQTPTPLPYNPPSSPAKISGVMAENLSPVNQPLLPSKPSPQSQPGPQPGNTLNNNAFKLYQARLTVTRGTQQGEIFKLNPGLNEIGRWDDDENYYPHVDLEKQDIDGYVHRRHAFIRLKDGNWWIEDAGGANGTRVRREGQTTRLGSRGTLQLQSGDEIIIGRVFLLFESS